MVLSPEPSTHQPSRVNINQRLLLERVEGWSGRAPGAEEPTGRWGRRGSLWCREGRDTVICRGALSCNPSLPLCGLPQKERDPRPPWAERCQVTGPAARRCRPVSSRAPPAAVSSIIPAAAARCLRRDMNGARSPVCLPPLQSAFCIGSVLGIFAGSEAVIFGGGEGCCFCCLVFW